MRPEAAKPNVAGCPILGGDTTDTLVLLAFSSGVSPQLNNACTATHHCCGVLFDVYVHVCAVYAQNCAWQLPCLARFASLF